MSKIAHHTFEFDEIGHKPSMVRFTSPYQSSQQQVQITVNDSQFLYRRQNYMDPRLADLVDIGIAIHVVDRLSILKRKHNQRLLKLQLPLRHPEVFEQSDVYELLKEILHHYSQDQWEIHFVRRKGLGRIAELQSSMGDFNEHKEVEVALWSGGLDSLAGLYNRIEMVSAPAYTLFGTGSNKLIQGTQRQTALSIETSFPKHTIKCEQLPFRLIHIDKVPQNNASRMRGFLFLLLGAVCALLEGQQTLHIYENGIGAINLPYLKSSTGLNHSRAVHPISLCYMSSLITEILQSPFTYYNPFLYWTKAQLCSLPVKQGREYLLTKTITCDRIRRSPHIQCGRCSSCLLRRQALLANGLSDQPYVVPFSRSVGNPANRSDGTFLRAMLHQVNTIQSCLRSPVPWETLAREYPDLPSVVWWLASINRGDQKEIESNLTQLYKQYVTEWNIPNIRHTLSKGLLRDEEIVAIT